jgi:hypothetical protein
LLPPASTAPKKRGSPIMTTEHSACAHSLISAYA